MKPDVIVLGAGMVGVSAAIELQRRGHHVTLVDRREPGGETSYGNAGILQREAVEPYRFPRAAKAILRTALGLGADVRYHARTLPQLASPLARYWWNSAPSRYEAIARSYSRLIQQCLKQHAELMTEAGADDLVRRDGFRFGFRSASTFEREAADAERLVRTYGLACDVLDGPATAKAEPGLRRPLAGAVHWRDPWTVSDPGKLVARYAALFRKNGGSIEKGDASSLARTGRGWTVALENGHLEAQNVVVALGPWSATLTRGLGYRLPLFVKRGYHRHYSGADGRSPLDLPLFDLEASAVFAPMAQGLRITTGAELALIEARSTPVQMAKAERRASELFMLGEPVEDTPWRGARPCTADMLPVIGPAPRHPGLWFNFGHAHQGFTLGPATGRLLAEMIGGETPYVDPTPYAANRFRR